jgi:hypothetical protein
MVELYVKILFFEHKNDDNVPRKVDRDQRDPSRAL